MEILTQSKCEIVRNYDRIYLEVYPQVGDKCGFCNIVAMPSNPNATEIVLGGYENEERAQAVIKAMARHIGLGLHMFRMPEK